MVLICPTFAHNKTYDGFVDHYSHIFAIDCPQEEVELSLKLSSHFFQGTNALIVLDDCAASKDMKATQASWSLSAFLPTMQVSACGFSRSRSSASQNHSAKMWPPSFCNWPNKASRTRQERWSRRPACKESSVR